jgi:hypothetical protein
MSEPHYISVRLPLKIGPMDRGEMWEDPLMARLDSDPLGEVTGGGTMMDPDGGIAYCDLEVALPDLTDKRLDELQAHLDALGAPKGTEFITDDGNSLRSFGKVSAVGIGLDGSGLPDEAYEGFDPDTFNDQILSALGDGYSYGGSHAGERYTYFYYHGADAGYIYKTLRAIAEAQPIGQGAQFDQVA